MLQDNVKAGTQQFCKIEENTLHCNKNQKQYTLFVFMYYEPPKNLLVSYN